MLITKKVNVPLDSDYESEKFMNHGGPIIFGAQFEGIVVSDISIEVHQSADGVLFGQITETIQALSVGHESHQWNLINLPKGSFVKFVLKHGTSVNGVLKSLFYQSED